MEKVYLGNGKTGNKIELDFDKEKINFILLIGITGSGKSAFHHNLYKKLSEKYSSDEIGFVFLDNTAVDFNDYQSDYVIKSVFGKPKEAINVLCEIASMKTNKKIFIHIEEYDMVSIDRKSVEIALGKIKDLKNIYVVYSTSRIDWGYLADWRKRLVDLTIAFRVPTENDSNILVGNDMLYRFGNAGDRMLIFNGQQILCKPFTNEEAKILNDFQL